MRDEEATTVLSVNDSFLPLVIKGKDGHFLNAIHTLEYFDSFKIPGYDAHLPSLSIDTYARCSCSICNKYFPTIAFLVKHKKFAHSSTQTKWPGKQSQTNSATIDDFSVLPSSSIVHEELAVIIKYISDGEV